MLVIAHAGHWALSLIQFFPLLAIAMFVAYRTLATKRGAGEPVGGRS